MMLGLNEKRCDNLSIAASFSTEETSHLRRVYVILEKSTEIGHKQIIRMSKNSTSAVDVVVNLASVLNNEKISRSKIVAVSGISTVTIRDRTSEIQNKIGGDIDGENL